MLPCLDAAESARWSRWARSRATSPACWWTGRRVRRPVSAIDPTPQDGSSRWSASPRARAGPRDEPRGAAGIPLPDAVIVDGDHNYYTVSEELRLIGERAPGAELPLLLFHDVCWPHARRDDYFAPEQIPADHRQPLAGDGAGIFPGEPGRAPGGPALPALGGARGRPAERRADRRRGLRRRPRGPAPGRRAGLLRLRRGLAQDAPCAGELARILDPWDRNPMLERLEANRVHQLARRHARQREIWRVRERQARQEAVLRRLLESSAFAVAERLSRLRVRAGIATEQSVGLEGRDPPRARATSGV